MYFEKAGKENTQRTLQIAKEEGVLTFSPEAKKEIEEQAEQLLKQIHQINSLK